MNPFNPASQRHFNQGSFLRTVLLAALFLLSFPALFLAQEEADEDSQGGFARDFWQCETPAGKFTIRLSEITSVSKHEYVVDGAARVIEVNVGTSGPITARFYYLEPVVQGRGPTEIVREKVDEAAERIYGKATESDGPVPWKRVIKNYPATTHAHTVEYRVSTPEELDQIFTSAERSWIRGQGERVTLGGE